MSNNLGLFITSKQVQILYWGTIVLTGRSGSVHSGDIFKIFFFNWLLSNHSFLGVVLLLFILSQVHTYTLLMGLSLVITHRIRHVGARRMEWSCPNLWEISLELPTFHRNTVITFLPVCICLCFLKNNSNWYNHSELCYQPVHPGLWLLRVWIQTYCHLVTVQVVSHPSWCINLLLHIIICSLLTSSI